MKKLLLMASAMVFTLSCSSSDDSSSNNSNTALNQEEIRPPQWLHGEWLRVESQNQATDLGYKITYSDVCNIYNFDTDDKYCVYEFIKQLNQGNYISKVVQKSTNDSYFLEIREESQFTYDFIKIDNSTISVRQGIKSNPYIKYQRIN